MAASVVIAYCAPENHATLFGVCKDRLLLAEIDRLERGEPRLVVDVLAQISSPRIASTRNSLVDGFLRHPADPTHLLMLDADVVFPVDVVERLLEASELSGAPLVSGVYFGGRHHGEQHAHIYRINEVGDAFDPIEGMRNPDDAIALNGWGAVTPIDAAGAGCLLMRRDALVTIGDAFTHTGYPWFVEGTGPAGAEYGEDIAFCLRARSLGIPMVAHTGVQLGHLKLGVLDQHTHAAYQAERDVLGVDEVRARANARLHVPVQGEKQVTS